VYHGSLPLLTWQNEHMTW